MSDNGNGNGSNGNGAGFSALFDLTQPEARELDLGGMVGALAGVKVKCYVNKPGIREAFAESIGRTIKSDYDREGNLTHQETIVADSRVSYDRHRRVVALMFDQPLEKVNTLDDDKLLWLFNEGYRLVNEYGVELKNSSATLPELMH